MMKKNKNIDNENIIIDEVSNISKTISTLLIKNANYKNKKKIEELTNKDPRINKKQKNPKNEIKNDLNIC